MPETYRFDPSRPRRRRYAGEKPEETAETTETTDSEDEGGPGWTVARPDHLLNGSTGATTPEPRRPSRAERRRQAENPSADETDEDTADEYASTRRSDLTRIATFLRRTQETEADSADDEAAAGVAEKTSELPTVTRRQPTPLIPSPAEPVDATDSVLAAVRDIPGVNGARLTDSDQRLALDVADDADAELVQRQVADILNRQLGVQARPVSAAVGTIETDGADRGVPAVSRAVLERIQVITSGFESTVEVALAVDGARAVGRASGPAVDWHILRGAADATVDAVGVLVGRDARVVVEHASIEPAGSVKVALVVVLLLTEAGAEQLAGAAPVTGDRRQAIVHATLSALNRRIEALLA
ncbi:hypothetical protein [Stackebrandtia albiflava]|uniref:hypothetical protein n=1 Tax=Stackebrandtia albiflava TaxID=406432 RepID=UPI0011BDF976|nr:hypothetical protein [Stackebrandtia albiflava]